MHIENPDMYTRKFHNLLIIVSVIGALSGGCIKVRNDDSSQGVFDHGPKNNSPQVREELRRSVERDAVAGDALKAGQYAKAESLAREASSSEPSIMSGRQILAEALEAQNKDAEALQEYGVLIQEGRYLGINYLHSSLLLLKANRWPEAVAAYNKAVPQHIAGDAEMLRVSYVFSPKKQQPEELATAIHIGLGLCQDPYWHPNQPMYEFEQALKISPNSPVAKYYYNTYLRYATANHLSNTAPK